VKETNPSKIFKEDALFADKVQASVAANPDTDFVTDNIAADFSDNDGDNELDRLEISQRIVVGDALDVAAQAKHCHVVWVAVNSGACLENFGEEDCGIELADCQVLFPNGLKRQDSNYTIVTTLEYSESSANALTISFFAVAASVVMALLL